MATKKTLDDYKTLARQLVDSANQTRLPLQQAMENIFFMRSEKIEALKGAWIKKTISPDPHNAVIGAQRMLTATAPKFKVPEYVSDTTKTDLNSKLVDWGTRTWTNAGKIRQSPIQIEGANSAVIFGEVNLATTRSQALVEMATETGVKAEIQRAEHVKRRTALLPEVLNPRICYPVVGSLGLETHLTVRKMEVHEAIRRGGKNADALLSGRKPFDSITWNEIFDLENHVIWITEAAGSEVLLEPHELRALPIVYRKIEGSSLWNMYDKTADAIMPFCWAVHKSGMWENANMSETALASLMFAIGASGLFKFKSNGQPGRTLEIDWEHPGALVTLMPTEDLVPMATNILTPEMFQLLQHAREVMTESTIYKQTLGEPLGNNATFSMVAMLSQAGRQPLIPYQRLLSEAISECMNNGIIIMQDMGDTVEWRTADGQVVFDPKADIGEDEVELEAELEIDLPQDTKSDVQVAIAAINGGLLDQETALRDIMKQEQPEKIIKAILRDRMINTLFEGALKKIQAQTEMEIRSAMQPQGQPQPGGPGGPPQGPPPEAQPPQGPPQGGAQLTPELMQQIMSNQAQQGLPQTSPQEPQMGPGPEAMPANGNGQQPY